MKLSDYSDYFHNNYLIKGVKKLISFVPSRVFEKFLHHSLLTNEYREISNLKNFKERESLWKDISDNFKNEKITFLEFGVYKGYSIRKFSELNTNKESSFIGFDSFEGLPEFWTHRCPKGSLSAGGLLPEVNDKRISFEKGWFQNTLPKLIDKNIIGDKLIVHYDADLYSSTLFVLSQMDNLKIPYYAIFDEILGEETRAIYNYQQISGAKIEFIGKTTDSGYPSAVSCKIIPCKTFEVY